MKAELFDELLGAAHEVLEHVQGKRELRTTHIPLTPDEAAARANAVAEHAGRRALTLLADAQGEYRAEPFQRDQLWRFLVKKGAAS